jgi:peroxiredoxin (alkyl hydroperoxide reductase subunit C)
MRGFQQLIGELESLGARVAGISSDTFAALGAFAEQNGLTFPVLSDWPAYRTIAAFGVGRPDSPTAQRATFIFDAEGVLRGVVDDQRDMNAHPQGALKVLREIAGQA